MGTLRDHTISEDEGKARIHRLWNEIAGHSASDYDGALDHLLAAICELISAQNAYWTGLVRLDDSTEDATLGWRASRIHFLHAFPTGELVTERRVNKASWEQPDELLIAHAHLAGSFRAVRVQDMVPASWFAGARCQAYRARGLQDMLYVGIPVSETAESLYCFIRSDDTRFAQHDVALAAYAMRGVPGLHRNLLLAHGLLIAASPLSPTERRVLSLLLTDKQEKQIAGELNLSYASLHNYVRDILRKFGVSGRVGLIALWLRQ